MTKFLFIFKSITNGSFLPFGRSVFSLYHPKVIVDFWCNISYNLR